MGRVAAAGDNATMESFHSLLQKNVFNRRRWRTRSELTYETIVWIEYTYNRRRRQASSAGSPRSNSSSPSPRCPASKTKRRHDQSQPPSTNRAADPQRHGDIQTERDANVCESLT